MHVDGGGDPEVEADLEEEMAVAAADAKEAAESESVPTLGAVTRSGPRVTPDPTIPSAGTVAFEYEEAKESEKDADAELDEQAPSE